MRLRFNPQNYRLLRPFVRSEGMTLIEVLVVSGVMGFLMLIMMTMQSNQMKTTNYLEFQLKRTQLQGTLVGQFLKDSNNCACLFNGASEFPVAGVAALGGVTPTPVGMFTSAAPACGAPAQFFVGAAAIDGLIATSISLQNIVPTADPNIYSGFFNLSLQSAKEVMGPRDLGISIPVSIATSPGTPGNVAFQSCGTSLPVMVTPLTTVSRTFPGFDNGFCLGGSNINVGNINCPAGTSPEFCGIQTLSEEEHEDAYYCTLDIPKRRCIVTNDRSGNGCGSARGDCFCR